MPNRFKINFNVLLSISLIILAIVSRLVPHPANFAPVTAIALFAGYAIKDKVSSIFLPLTIMFISDLFLGFHNTLFFVYASYIMIALLSRTYFKDNFSFSKGIISVAGSSLVFYIVTNFGSWLMDTQLYSKDLNGLLSSYILALPFFRNEVLGNLCYSTFLFGVYSLIHNSLLKPITTKN